MAQSTGPILAVGAITLFNDVIVHGRGIEQDLRVVVGTAIAAGGLALVERASPGLAVGLAWLTLIGVLFVRIDPKIPAPVEAFSSWYNAK